MAMTRIDMLERGLVDQNGVAIKAEIRDGKEYGDPTPMAPPAHIGRAESNAEMIRRMIQNELSSRASMEGYESFEEAEDFDIDDDPADPHTPYEAVFDPPPKPPIKEKNDGKPSDDKGRNDDSKSGSGKPDPERKGKSVKKPDDAASVRGADKADRESEGEAE